MSKGWVTVWIILAFVLAVVLFQPAKTPDGDPSVENPQTHEVPFHPNAVAVILTHDGISTVPGTIVCPDLATVNLLFSLYNQSWEDGMQDQMTRGQSRTIRGPSASTPDPSNYGCSLLPPGTPVQVMTDAEVSKQSRKMEAYLRRETKLSDEQIAKLIENAKAAVPPGIPQITAKLPDGTYLQGVTLPSMLLKQ